MNLCTCKPFVCHFSRSYDRQHFNTRNYTKKEMHARKVSRCVLCNKEQWSTRRLIRLTNGLRRVEMNRISQFSSLNCNSVKHCNSKESARNLILSTPSVLSILSIHFNSPENILQFFYSFSIYCTVLKCMGYLFIYLV